MNIYEDSGVVKRKIRIGVMVILLSVLVAGILILYYYGSTGKLKIVCPIYTFTGFYCPGCGAGRAVLAMLQGEWYQAFRYNPLLVILLPWLVLYYMIAIVQWVVSGKEKLSRDIPGWIPFVIFIIVLVYGVIRNISIYPLNLLAPTKL